MGREKFNARKLPSETQDDMRQQVMRMHEKLKLSRKEIARVAGVHMSAVIGWYKRYSMEAPTGLKWKTRGRVDLPGRTLKLITERYRRSVIVTENSKQLSLPLTLRNRRALMQQLKVLLEIELPIRTIGKYLLLWGYTPQRPTKRAEKQNPAKIELTGC